jgi:hypothetical protein
MVTPTHTFTIAVGTSLFWFQSFFKIDTLPTNKTIKASTSVSSLSYFFLFLFFFSFFFRICNHNKIKLNENAAPKEGNKPPSSTSSCPAASRQVHPTTSCALARP